jgi:hypothetical protein
LQINGHEQLATINNHSVWRNALEYGNPADRVLGRLAQGRP